MMPIILKDFSWRQTSETLYITVKVKGIKKAKASFVTSDNYIRLHFQPYYFELFLWGRVDEGRSKCTLVEDDDLAVFELRKIENGIQWPSVDLPQLTKEEKHSIRTEAVEKSQMRAAQEIATALAHREEQRQMTIREQLKIDAEARKKIATLRSFYTDEALNEFDAWKNNSVEEEKFMIENKSGKIHGNIEDSFIEEIVELKDEEAQKSEKNPKVAKSIWSEAEIASKSTQSSQTSKNLQNSPKIRESNKISVSFTPREFPTPSRESTAVLEEEWLKKQVEARKNCGFNDEELRDEERNPDWLYEKGESLMKSESYVGAVSAYSTGIKLAPKMGELFAGRARAHLALNNIRKAVEDASQGLELLMPKVEQNAKYRVECHRVRGEGFAKLKMSSEAVIDLSQALEIDPTNAQVREELSVQKKLAEEEEMKSSEDES